MKEKVIVSGADDPAQNVEQSQNVDQFQEAEQIHHIEGEEFTEEEKTKETTKKVFLYSNLRIVLFKNEKRTPKDPDYSGKISIDRDNDLCSCVFWKSENKTILSGFLQDYILNNVVTNKEAFRTNIEIESLQKENDKAPALKGKIKMDDTNKYSLSLWKRKSEKDGREYFSGSIYAPLAMDLDDVL